MLLQACNNVNFPILENFPAAPDAKNLPAEDADRPQIIIDNISP